VVNTPLEYQSLYIKCWDEDPNKRPSIKEVSEKLKKMNPIHQSQSLLSSSDEITEISSSDFSDSDLIYDFGAIKKRADDEKEHSDSIIILDDNEKIIISEEDKNFLNILVTIFISSVNNGDEYFQTTISLFCFIDENNRDPINILKLLTFTQEIEYHSCIIGLCYLCYGTDLDKTRAFNFFKTSLTMLFIRNGNKCEFKNGTFIIFEIS